MKRSVIQLASNTLVVSLPSKWAKQRGIKKGDEVEVDEQGTSLIVSKEKSTRFRRTVLAGADLDQMLGRSVGALYKAGYDEIEVQFANKSQLHTIQEVLRRSCIGFEIVKQGRNFVIAKEISKAEQNEFDQVLRRTFLFVLNMAEELREAVQNKDTEGLAAIPLMDDTVDRYCDF